jgi:hypothetical protein
LLFFGVRVCQSSLGFNERRFQRHHLMIGVGQMTRPTTDLARHELQFLGVPLSIDLGREER